MRNFKITMVGTFDNEDLKIIYDFVDVQETSDRLTEPTVVSLDNNIEAKVIVRKYYAKEDYSFDNSYIEKIIFRKVK